LEDVSEQRILERKLAQKEKANLLESLVGGIAHELNNKLTPILMFAEMVIDDLKAKVDPTEAIGHCDAMRKSAIEASRIIRQLLQLSKPAKMELARCHLRDIVEDTLTILNHRLRQADVTLELVLPEVGELCILADAQQIKQVLVNLMINSLDAMEQSPRHHLRLELTRDNGACLLVLTDSGCGIAPQHLSRVFDPFFTTKAPDRGTGLGLSVCYNIIKQHAGELTLQSAPGEGTQIRMKLPLALAAQVDGPAATEPIPERVKSRTNGARRVLIVDDEDTIAVMLRSIVQRSLGCRADWVSDGQTAIERLHQDAYDLVISDVRMPHVSGLDLLRWVREQRPEMASRFIFITGDAGSNDLNEDIETLGVPVLRKPFSMEVFVTQCQLLLPP
jgi:CheY-like chemotaxis protein